MTFSTTTPIVSTQSDITVAWDTGTVSMSSCTMLEDALWEKQQFELKTMLGEFDIESDVRFEPAKDRFQDWITQIEWSDNTWELALTSKITRTTDWIIAEIGHEGAVIDTAFEIRFRAPTRSCASVFYDTSLELAFDWCGVETDIEIAIDADGFDEWSVAWSDLAVAKLDWITFDVEWTQTLGSRTFKINPAVTLEDVWCDGDAILTFEGQVANSPGPYPLSITEAVLSLEMPEWDVEATAILDPNEWISHLYWLELEAEMDVDLPNGRQLGMEMVLQWTQAVLGRAEAVLTADWNGSMAAELAVIWDLEHGELDQLTLSVELEWPGDDCN